MSTKEKERLEALLVDEQLEREEEDDYEDNDNVPFLVSTKRATILQLANPEQNRAIARAGAVVGPDVEPKIASVQALLERMDMAVDHGASEDVAHKVQWARGVLVNAFFALYGGFGEQVVIEA